MAQFSEEKKQKTVVIGAGPVGSLAALYAAERDHEVEVYELRGDLRDPSTTPLNFTRSINLALSERGINALWHSNRTELTEKILEQTIPMTGRMIHRRDKSGSLYEESQPYDINGRAIYAIDRCDLNNRLLNELASLPNVKLFFNHKLTSVDFKSQKAWLRPMSASDSSSSETEQKDVEVSFDLLIGADGAHSATRFHLMKHLTMDYSQFYVDILWCEFTIKANNFSNKQSPNSKFKITPDHLHIWPGTKFMFIAIPSLNGEFTCTLFMPKPLYEKVSVSSDALVEFFHENFPGVTPELISPTDLVESFNKNPHLPLISITCSPHHYSHCAVILGDATHAMVPFYGQGMNAGFEDVRVLFQTLDKYLTVESTPERRALALEEYSALRTVDSRAISQLALQNYQEMASAVNSRLYKSRKWLEEKLSQWFPSLGWATKYSRVSFGNERYSEVIRRSEWQGLVLERVLSGLGIGILGGIFWGLWRFKSAVARFPSH